MHVIAAQRNIQIDRTCYVINEPLIQKQDMSVKLVANISQKNFKLTRRKCVTKKNQMEQKQLEEETEPLPKQRRQITESIRLKAAVEQK